MAAWPRSSARTTWTTRRSTTGCNSFEGRADPAERDATTQFYIAYAFYRQGWGRVYNDDALFTAGIAAVDKAIAAAPNGRLIINDPDLQMHSGDELRAELQRGVTREAADLNPLKVLRTRK